MDATLIASELRRLSRLKPDGWNEADVREEFIAPLLSTLGYTKGSDYDVNREGKHLLSKPFLFVGRSRIEVDYALLVRKRSFWIIEAKAASPKQLDEQAVFQAHFYALHPEVDARFFVVTNAWEIVVYDTRNLGEYEPVLRIELARIYEDFEKLSALVGATAIRKRLRDRLLNDMRDVLATEVREENLSEFSNQMRSVLDEVRPLVRENWRQLHRAREVQADHEFADVLAGGSLDQIIRVGFELPQSAKDFENVKSVFDGAFGKLDLPEKIATIHSMVQTLWGRPTTTLRRNLIHVLMRLIPAYDAAYAERHTRLLRAVCRDACVDQLNDFERYPLWHELWQLEGNLYRVNYKMTFAAEPLRQRIGLAVAEKTRLLQEEDLVVRRPSQARERVTIVERLAEELFGRVSRANVEQLRVMNAALIAAEEALDGPYKEAYARTPRAEKDLSFYQSYNKPFDFAASGLCAVLAREWQIVSGFVDEEMIRLVAAKLKRRGQGYAVNHTEDVITQWCGTAGRVTIDPSIAQSFPGGLDEKRFASLSTTLHNDGRLGSSDVRLWGEIAPGEYGELFCALDLDALRLTILRWGALK